MFENYFRLNGHGALVRCRREGSEVAGAGVCSAGVNSLAGTKFEGICAGKGTSAGTPYGASRDPIPTGVPVILDFGINARGLPHRPDADVLLGRPSDEVLAAYAAMVRVEESIIKSLTPGRGCEDMYNESVALASELGYAEEFMGLGTEKVKFVGHGIGLELDEPPYLAPKMIERLAEGVVVAVEPKVSLPGVGVIGVEDTLVVRSKGAQSLTDCSKEFVVVQ